MDSDKRLNCPSNTFKTVESSSEKKALDKNKLGPNAINIFSTSIEATLKFNQSVRDGGSSSRVVLGAA